MTKAEQFAKLNGIEWKSYWWCHQCKGEIDGHNVSFEEKCCICGTPVMLMDTTDFTDAKSILEVMMKRKDYDLFLINIANSCRGGWSYLDTFINLYILNPDKLLDEAIEFCEKLP